MAWTFAGQWGPEAIIDHRGNAQRGAKVYVYEPGTENLATLWESRDKDTEADNPVEVDSKGNLKLFADPGLYRAEVYRDGVKRFEFDVAVSGELALAEGEFLRGAGAGPTLEAIDSGTFIAALDADVTITVGDGGEYSTISEALTAASRYRALYALSGVKVEVHLLSGFVMAEQVFVDGVNLAFIIITAEDSEVTIDRSALTDNFGKTYYPAFTGWNGATLPVINVLFSMDGSGDAADRAGVDLKSGSKAIFESPAGIKNAATRGANIHENSVLVARSGNFSGAGTAGLRIANGSQAFFRNGDASGAGGNGIQIGLGAEIHATHADLGGVASSAIRASGGKVWASGVTAPNAGTQGVHATDGAEVWAIDGDLTGAGAYGILADSGAVVYAQNVNARKGSEDSPDDIHITDDATAYLDGAIGGVSKRRRLWEKGVHEHMFPAVDTFERNDESELGIADSGHGWVMLDGSRIAVVDGRAQAITNGDSDARTAVVDVGIVNGLVSARVILNHDDHGPGLAFRANEGPSNDSDLLAVRFASGELGLIKVVDGSLSSITSVTVPFSDGDEFHLAVKIEDDEIAVYVDGVEVLTHTLSAGDASTFDGNTMWGLSHATAGTDPQWRDFMVRR